jgi:hypothetical protein
MKNPNPLFYEILGYLQSLGMRTQILDIGDTHIYASKPFTFDGVQNDGTSFNVELNGKEWRLTMVMYGYHDIRTQTSKTWRGETLLAFKSSVQVWSRETAEDIEAKIEQLRQSLKKGLPIA